MNVPFLKLQKITESFGEVLVCGLPLKMLSTIKEGK